MIIPKAGENVEKLDLSNISGGNVKWYSRTLFDSFLAYDPTIVFFGVHPKEIKTHVHTNVYIQMFTEVLLVTAKY